MHGYFPPDCYACMDSGYGCCQFWMGALCEPVGSLDARNEENIKLQTWVASLEEENTGRVKANRKLSAQANEVCMSQTKNT